jgi:hypothetical protein
MTNQFNNDVAVIGMKPVADGVVYHTRYQAHNLITHDIKECAILADLVEATITWDEPSNAIKWYEITYKGNKAHFNQEDVVHSGFLDETNKHMVYRLRDTIKFNQSLLASTDDLVIPEEYATNVTLSVVIEVPGDVEDSIATYDPDELLRDAIEGKYHIHETSVTNVDVKEVF